MFISQWKEMIVLDNLKGSPYERGEIQGAKLEKEIQREMYVVFESELIGDHIPKIVPISLVIRALGVLGYRSTHKYLKKYLPAQLAKLQGIQKGAKLSRLVAYSLHFIEVMGNNPNTAFAGPMAACSQIFATPKVTNDGNPLIVRNYDFPAICKTSQMIRIESPEDRLKNITVSHFPLAGSHTGLNEKGVYIAINYGLAWKKKIDFSFAGIPPTFIVQEALETCSTTQEAVDFITSFPVRSIGAHFGIADKSGDMRFVETTKTRSAIRIPLDSGFLYQTNTYVSPDIKDANAPDSMKWDVKGLNVPYIKSPRERFNRISELVGNLKPPIDQSDLRSIVSDHNNRTPDDFTVCMHGLGSDTVCSVIAQPKNLTLSVADGFPCETEYKTYSLK
jgi:acyl-CoA:6-aminopenicillanic acid acyl transferase